MRVAARLVTDAAATSLTPHARLRRSPRDTFQLMDFRLSDEQQLLRRSVREFAEAEIRPHVREWDEAQHFPAELLPKLADLGLMGIQFAPEFGGAGMSAVDYCICIEELARVDPSVSLSVAAHNGLGAAHLAMFGNRRPEAALPHAARPGREARRVGTDRARLRQRRRRDANGRGARWRLRGC